MKRRGIFAVCAAIMALSAAQAVRGGTLHGTVRNGTTGAPAAGVEVFLLQLQGGMDTVANTKTDAQGAFTFVNPSIGERPMLVRAVYRGVNFHQAVPPGRDVVQVEVFEPSLDAKIVTYPTRVVIFQPSGASLLVGEEYTVQNGGKPPQAYFRADGNFEIQLPEKAELQQVAAWGPSAMPVVQATIDRAPNKYAIAFAFRPGENGVRLSYRLPYEGNNTVVHLPAVYPVGHLLVAAPPGVEVRAEGLQASGTEQGMSIYTREALSAGKALDISIAGQGTAPAAGGGQESGGTKEGSANIQVIPSRLDALKWPVVAGFAGLFALGAIFLLRKPVPAGMEADAAPENVAGPKRRKKDARPSPAAQASAAASTTVAEVQAQVEMSLDALKDKIFRLELRRQAGTISEEEYARERAKAEQILRELIRG